MKKRSSFAKGVIAIISIFLLACFTKPTKKERERKLNIVSQESGTINSLRGISVVDSNIVWLSGAKGTILKTSNGGKKWQLLLPPDQDSLDFRDVEAFSANEAIIVSAGFPARIYKTQNAGVEWRLVYENKDSAAFMNSINFKNEREGIVIGDQLQGRHLILKTIDRGDTWERIDSTAIPKPLKNENGFAASGSCIAIDESGNYFIGLGGGNSRVFSSSDGINWEANESKLKTAKTSSGIYSIAHGNELLMAVGGDYTETDSVHQAVVSEGGKFWRETSGLLNGYRSVVDYSSVCNCWVAAGTNGVDISYDHGESWGLFSDLDINTFQFTPNGSSGYLASKKGGIYLIKVD